MTRRDGIVAAIGLAVGMGVAALGATLASDQPLPSVSAGIPAQPQTAAELEALRIAALEILVPTAPQVFYQYIDETGAVRFTESLHDVPEAWRESAGHVELDVVPPSTPVQARVLRKLREGGAE
ncbi:MAG: hypothetical protein QNK03_14795 [Myxococcota bacterium]|nr:hypothetical protein [Myxococcota bacterium]